MAGGVGGGEGVGEVGPGDGDGEVGPGEGDVGPGEGESVAASMASSDAIPAETIERIN